MLSDISTARKPTTKRELSASADWTPQRVLYELHLRGCSLRQLSLHNGLHERSLSCALRKPWPRGEQIIARALRVKASAIWPSRRNRASREKAK